MIPLCEIVRLCVDVGLKEASEFYFQVHYWCDKWQVYITTDPLKNMYVTSYWPPS
jgi:hypothetical protein